ncbi:MAG: MFS transporter [Chloroflexota bacterium]
MNSTVKSSPQKNVRFNFAINMGEAGFFGMGMGFASYVTVIPLFVASLTDSAVLIGLISAMRLVGWQLPQLITANRVAGMKRYKPLVMLMTLNERLPLFVLALIAIALPTIGREAALILTFIFVSWQALGAGLTATPWISMTAKIIPATLRGRFYGTLGSSSNLLSSIGAVTAGIILTAGSETPESFALCFLLAGLVMLISFGFLSLNREETATVENQASRSKGEFWRGLGSILRRDANFRRFLMARTLAQVTGIGTAFFTIYAVRNFGMDAGTAGLMTGVLLIAQVIGSPLVGYLGDRFSHRLLYAVGALMAGAAAALAAFAPSLEWFYVVFALAGFANAGFQTTMYVLSSEFGSAAERPFYIGLGNTVVAPATLLAPIIGGILADSSGYQTTFGVAAVFAVLTIAMMVFGVREPRQQTATPVAPEAYAEQREEIMES